MTERKIEQALERFLRSKHIPVGSDGLGNLHIVFTRGGGRTVGGGLHTTCPLQIQIGESCGFDHERLTLAEIAHAIAEDL